MLGTAGTTRGVSQAARAWFARAFAGLTWRRFGIFCLVLIPFAMSRPNVRNAVLGGAAAWPLAQVSLTAWLLTFVKFTPILLAVVAAANLSPQRPWPKLLWMTAALVGSSLVGTALVLLTMPLVMANPQLVRSVASGTAIENATRFVGLATIDLVLCSVAVALVYFIQRSNAAAAELQGEQQHRERVERENAEARLSLMQAQIEPHFLFNSLAIIRRLYETDPARGRAMLRHLSSYLAASLPALREARSTLGRELALAVAYLNVQQIRMGPRLEVEVDVPDRLHEMSVPPMMLATLAENAVIHGVGPLPKGGKVTIRARHVGDRLAIEVADDGRGLQDTWGAGVGLANIQARLASEFGDAAAFNLRTSGERGVTASIHLPVRPAAA